MKIFIWAMSIFITSIVSVLIKSAGITLGAIPTMILYFAFQKKIMTVSVGGGIKG